MRVVFAIIAGIYLLNPTAGILEFIPDNIPLIGNLDEVGAVWIIIDTLRHYRIIFNSDKTDIVK